MNEQKSQIEDLEREFMELKRQVAAQDERIRSLEEAVLLRPEPHVMAEVPKHATSEAKEWQSNQVGHWNIKVVYPGIFADVEHPTAGFPKNRRKVAAQIHPGMQMFVYCSSPLKRIVGLCTVTSEMKYVSGRWPYSLDLAWSQGGPKAGVTLAEVGLDIRPRVGDTLFSITEEAAQRIIGALQAQPTLGEATLAHLADLYREPAKTSVSHEDAVRRLREQGMEQAAQELEQYKAEDGSKRGWDEVIENGPLHQSFPEARRVIWPDVYAK